MTRLACAVVVLLLVGCGGDDEPAADSGGDGRALLERSVKEMGERETFRQRMTMKGDVEGQSVTMRAVGSYTTDTAEGSMTATIQQASGDIEFDAVTVGGMSYLRGENIGIPVGKEWIKTERAPANLVAPDQWIDYLLTSKTEIEEAGEEEIRGEPTTHVRGPLDMGQVGKMTGQSILEEFASSPEADKMTFMVDVWVDPAGLPARIQLDLSAEGETDGVTVTSEMLEYDVPVNVKAPPEESVANAAEQGA
jgi:LppX_LprAFG lipoprotein